jgi:hypothetical protein
MVIEGITVSISEKCNGVAVIHKLLFPDSCIIKKDAEE